MNAHAASAPISLSEYPRPVIHIDCDAFFTSVEQALDPSLKGKPLVTGRERGIVACASYEAKALGVKRPMALHEARKICPQLVCLPSDYETYSLYSKRLFGIMRRFTPDVEEYSIDEAFAELSGLRRLYRTDFPGIARMMKRAIQEELGLTVSVGISSSKTLAKLASKREKPDGFTSVPANRLHEFLPTVAVPDVCGFGPNTTALLRKHGVVTAWDYVCRPEAWAKKLLGKVGVELWRELRGEAVFPLVTEEKHDYASISKCKTFTPSSTERDFVRAQLLRNFESAFIKLRRHRLRAGGIAVYLRDHDFRTRGVEGELDRPTSSTLEAGPLVTQLFDKVYERGRRYRLTGVVLSRLSGDTREVQLSFFDDLPKLKSQRAIDEVIDRAAERFGKHALSLASGGWLARQRQHESERGDVPRRKSERLKGESARKHLALPVWHVPV